tara:strand:- start:1420 stop:1842 length:423 start_codon:yes stop_codon:yes gene_type:complete
MGIETKYEYTYYTVIGRGDMGWCDDAGFTWEKAIDFINHKFKNSNDKSVNKYRVEYAGYEQDIENWIRTHERHKERPVFVQFQDDQPIMRHGEGSMFVLYEIIYGEDQEDDLEYNYSIGGVDTDINEGSLDGLAGAGGRL